MARRMEGMWVMAETMTLAAVIGRNVRRIRKERGLKQYELAERSRISLRKISRLERHGEIGYVYTLQRLAYGLGVEVEELVRL